MPTNPRTGELFRALGLPPELADNLGENHAFGLDNGSTTSLAMGTVADGEALKRSGNTIVGYTATDGDEKAKVSANDTTAGYLNGKLTAGTNITLTEGSDGANETLAIAMPFATTLRTTTGPTTLTIGAVADGEFLKRVGATVVGAAVGLDVAPIQSVGTSIALSAVIPVTRLTGLTGQAVTLPVPTTNGFRKTIRNGGDDGGTAVRTITSATANRIQETDSVINSIVLTGENASITLIGDLLTTPGTPIWRVECVSTGTDAGVPGSVVINYAT